MSAMSNLPISMEEWAVFPFAAFNVYIPLESTCDNHPIFDCSQFYIFIGKKLFIFLFIFRYVNA